MKNLLLLIPTVFLLNSCSQVDGANPSQNKALNMVAGKKEKKAGYMQNALDNWLKTQWEPSTSNAKKPTADTKVKIVPKDDGTAELVDVESGTTLKKLSKDEVKQREEVTKAYKDKDRPFTLQEYVNKLSIYNQTHVTDEEHSHYHKIKSMPVIGDTKR